MFKQLCTPTNIIFLILLIVLLVFLPKIAEILLLFFAAYVIACALNPFANKLEKKMNRVLSSAIVVLVAILTVGALFIPIFFVAFKEIKAFIMLFPERIERLADFFNNIKIFGQSPESFANSFDLSEILHSSTGLAQNVVNQSLNFTMNAFQLVVVVIAMLMMVYYILVDKKYLKDKFIEFFPPNLKERAGEILTAISTRVGGYVRIQLLSMAAVGIMTAIFVAFFGIDYPILLGLIAGIFDIIPILGPALSLGLILLVAYPISAAKAAGIVCAFLLVQQLSNYVIRPILFGKFMSLNPLMIFFALFVAQQFLGFWGVILSPALAATTCVLIDELYLKNINNINGD